MKKLYIIRHAKSSWDGASVSDFNRKLNERGVRDASFMADMLARRGASPDIIISSPAERAKETARLMACGVGYKKSEIVYNDLLYSSSLADLYLVLKNIDDRCHEVYVIGHNFVLSELAEELTGGGLITIPTSGVVAMTCAMKSWSEISPACGTMLFFDFPKNYTQQISE